MKTTKTPRRGSAKAEKTVTQTWAKRLARLLAPDWDGFSNGFPPKDLEEQLARCKPVAWVRLTRSGF